jgi:hypothetical protein
MFMKYACKVCVYENVHICLCGVCLCVNMCDWKPVEAVPCPSPHQGQVVGCRRPPVSLYLIL